MPVTYAPEAERTANRQQLYADLNAAMNTPYSATSGGWYGPPVYGGPNMLPAVQASGAHYSAPGSREGWIEHGIPPVVYQRSPYATAAFRAVPDPWGGMTVAPLVGFPSRYPHVLSGVPTRPGTLAMSVAAPYIMRPPAPTRQPAAPVRRPAGNGNRQQPSTPPTTPTQPATPPTTPAQVAHPPAIPDDYVGLNTLEGGSMPRATVGLGMTAPQLRHDPDLTQANPNAGLTQGNRAAAAIDALNDMTNFYFATGQRPQLVPKVTQPAHPSALDADRSGIGATRRAQNMGLDRSVYWRDLQERTRAAAQARYEDLVRQQRGY